MALDVNTIAAIKEELCDRIIGMKIDKVQQPQRDMVILTLRGRNSETQKLLICVGTGVRVHLTEHAFDNPAAPPMFCMLLRKHLTGAKIEDITQPPSERMLYMSLSSRTSMGDASKMQLVLELFGRIPNIILTDGEGIIIDCLRRIGGDMSLRRMILPGLRYHAPEPLEVNAGTQEEHSQNTAGSISKTLDAVYTLKSKQENMRRRGSELAKTMKTAQKRIRRKLEAQRAELEETESRDYLRECADIIMANLHAVKKGDEILVADDFYAQCADGTAKREIKLDPLLSPQKNAAKYYKTYTKARNATQHLAKQIVGGERELEYIDSVLEQLVRAENERELDEIRDELVLAKYLKAREEKKKKTGKSETRPQQFKSSAGLFIWAGKNNMQNDAIVSRLAAKTDVWLHAQKIHGSHVVIKSDGKTVDDTTLQEAAAIAAYYSAARSAGKVPVDYTLVKNVKKTPGARPGMVIYTSFKTIIAQPDEELVMRLRT